MAFSNAVTVTRRVINDVQCVLGDVRYPLLQFYTKALKHDNILSKINHGTTH